VWLSKMLMVWLSFGLLTSWGSLYYAFPVLADAIQQDLGYSAETVAGAFSLALLIWGIASYPVGVVLDRWGGRNVMRSGALLAAAAFFGLSKAETVWAFYAMWVVLGIAMAMTLYEAASAVVVQSFPDGHRRRIGWLTVVGGLASTAFWPLSYFLCKSFGWRDTVLMFACLQLVLASTTLGMSFPRQPEHTAIMQRAHGSVPQTVNPGITHRKALLLLSVCFMIYGFITAAVVVIVINALQARGFQAVAAVNLAACIGPAQALGRAMDLLFSRRMDVRWLGILAMSLMSLSFVALWMARWMPGLCVFFVVAYGLGLGLLTIVRATVPLALSGTARYASNSAILGSPALMARALGPLSMVWLLEQFSRDDFVVWLLLLASCLGCWIFLRAWPNKLEAA